MSQSCALAHGLEEQLVEVAEYITAPASQISSTVPSRDTQVVHGSMRWST
jgi:hypothetical protein